MLVTATLIVAASALSKPTLESERGVDIVGRDPCALLVAIVSGGSGCDRLRDKNGVLKVSASIAIGEGGERVPLLKEGQRCPSKIEVPRLVNVRDEEPVSHLDITVRRIGPTRVGVTGRPDVTGELMFSAGKWRWRGPRGCEANKPSSVAVIVESQEDPPPASAEQTSVDDYRSGVLGKVEGTYARSVRRCYERAQETVQSGRPTDHQLRRRRKRQSCRPGHQGLRHRDGRLRDDHRQQLDVPAPTGSEDPHRRAVLFQPFAVGSARQLLGDLPSSGRCPETDTTSRPRTFWARSRRS
jgi:hypothetical protein